MNDDGQRWIQTYTGRKFYPLDPKPEDVCIEDIAWALSMKCRFGGHVKEFYSVASHSVYVSTIVPPSDALWGLLHDAAEAYLPDVCRPIKPALVGFRSLEDRVMQAVCKRFGLLPECPASVHNADVLMLAAERRDLTANTECEWDSTKGLIPPDVSVLPHPPSTANALFLATFHHLTRKS